MGKYMRKSKTPGEMALMEPAIGVRTRAKTLALQRLQNSSEPVSANSCGSYLQLRSRRLEKPTIAFPHNDTKRQRHQPPKENNLLNPRPQNPNPKNNSSRASSRLRVGSSVNSKEQGCMEEEKKVGVEKERSDGGENNLSEKKEKSCDGGFEASFGENMLEFEGRERSTRETTPCSLIRDPETIRTPGSSTRPTSTTDANNQSQTSIRRHIPTAHEMNDFFAGAEEEQQKQFVEKYNFDPMKDKPLPGRYEWVKMDP